MKYFFIKLHKAAHHSFEKGFTLIELVFVILIFAIMASIVLFRFNDFGARTDFENLTQDIALRIVSAQKAAVSGIASTDLPGVSSSLAPSYGVSFSDNSSGTDNREFSYFTDINHNSFNDGTSAGCGTGGDECLSVTKINAKSHISNLCSKSAVGAFSTVTFNCVSSGMTSVVFTRPWPAAKILVCTGTTYSTCPYTPDAMQAAYIEISSDVDPTLVKTIVVNSLGKVQVVDACAEQANDPTATCS